MKSRVWLLVLTLVASLVTVLGPGGPSGAVAAPRAAITLERLPAGVAPGQRIYLEGTIPGPRNRPVVVQQRRDGRWVAVARERTTTGDVFVSVRAPRRAGPVAWRLVAPEVRRRGTLYRRVLSPSRTTRVVVQDVRFRLPEQARVGTEVRAFVRFTPYLRDQGAQIFLLVNGRRERIASATMRPGGTHVRFDQWATGPVTYQVSRPGGGFVSRTLRGIPDPTVRPTRRVSVTSNGSQLGAGSSDASASDDGRYVAFTSYAGNAVPHDTDKHLDVFLKDTATGALQRVSHGIRGQQADDDSSGPVVSGDGRFVAFVSRARNLVPGDANGRADVFVWERATGRITRQGIDAEEPATSADGRYVAFTAGGRVLVRDLTTGALTQVSTGTDTSSDPAVSDDGSVVAYTAPDGVRLWDRATGTTELVAPGGRRPHLDADASVVAYEAAAGEHLGAYALDRSIGTTTLLATDADPGEATDAPSTVRVDSVTADGSQVLITSTAHLTDDDYDDYYCESESECYYDDYTFDAYVADVAAGTIALVSRSYLGEATEFFAEGFDLLADGSGVVFGSRDVLVPGQYSRSYYSSVHAYREVFVRDLD